jgi:hypothetical protein
MNEAGSSFRRAAPGARRAVPPARVLDGTLKDRPESIDALHRELQFQVESLHRWMRTLPHAPDGYHWEPRIEPGAWSHALPDDGSNTITLTVTATLTRDDPPELP